MENFVKNFANNFFVKTQTCNVYFVPKTSPHSNHDKEPLPEDGILPSLQKYKSRNISFIKFEKFFFRHLLLTSSSIAFENKL